MFVSPVRGRESFCPALVFDATVHHHHHRRRVAGEGRRVVAPPCSRSTARLQRSPVGPVESFRSWLSHCFRGSPGGRRHCLWETVYLDYTWQVCSSCVVLSVSVGRGAEPVQSAEASGPDREAVAALDQVQAAAVRYAQAAR